MPDFSSILQSDAFRGIVQQRIFHRAFHDALYPRLLFRGEAAPEIWPGQIGDTMVFSGVGLIDVDQTPLVPGNDPANASYPKEQWEATTQQYAKSIETHMPTSAQALANLFLRDGHQIGLNGAQTLNRIVRNRLYNAALSGHTVVNGAQGPTTTLVVLRLNGFTRARNPTSTDPLASPVRFDKVSSDNPLNITIGGVANTVIGFSAVTPGDEVGPGTLTLGTSVTVVDRTAVDAVDGSFIVRVGGGARSDDVTSVDILQFRDVRSAFSRLQDENVPPMPDRRFHMHVDPTMISQLYADPEFQRINTALPDYYIFRDYAIGEYMGGTLIRNTECPQVQTVQPKDGATFLQSDPFAGVLINPAGVKIHRALALGFASIYEYYLDLAQLITEAGVTGRVGTFAITNNGVSVLTDRIQLILRGPIDKLQQFVNTSYNFIGDWPVRTDAATGDSARYKRMVTVEAGS